MSSIRGGRRLAVVSLLVVVWLLPACKRWAQEPRYGGLQTIGRTFNFKHNIELFETSNGMRFALVRDTRTNLATVDLRYAVGAAEDPKDRAGMAHLVEHLLFFTRRAPDQPSAWDRLRAVALEYNATTTWDRTHYTSTVPIEHLSEVIALEGQRMAATCDQLDEMTFKRERDVVLAEETQRASPLTDTFYELHGAIYGSRHPYARRVGSREVKDATLAEACKFIETYYAPNRAYLVVTGPFDVTKTRELIGNTFGPVKRKATAPRTPIDPPELDGNESNLRSAVKQPTTMVALVHPAWGQPGEVAFLVATAQLASALRAADREHDWITGTGVYQLGGDRAPVLIASVEVDDVARLEDADAEVFARAARLGEQRNVMPLADAMTLRYAESWDNLAERGSWLADFMQYTDHNWFMLSELRAAVELRESEVIAGTKDNFARERARIIHLTPRPGGAGSLTAAVPAGSHDVTPWRAPVDPAEADRPIVGGRGVTSPLAERYQLTNGLNVELAPDAASPILDARLVFPVGRAHEGPDEEQVATAAAALLDHDTEGLYPSHMLPKLRFGVTRGTAMEWDVDETATTFAARGLAMWGDWHLWYLSWLLDQGHYNQDSIDDLHRAAREQAKRSADDDDTDPDDVLFLTRLFGAGHPYATPAPDSSAAYLELDADDLQRWRSAHFRAHGATLIVSGRFDVDTMKHEIDELFGPWSGAEPPALPPIPAPRPATGPSWLTDDEPESTQINIWLGFATTSDPIADHAARDVLVAMIDDELRVVREGMGASYGMNAYYATGAAGAALYVSGLVDEELAARVTIRVLAALEGLRTGAGAQREAFVWARRKVLGQALARGGGASAVAARLASDAERALPSDYRERLATQIRELTPAAVAAIAASDLALERMALQLTGRTAAIDAVYAALGVQPERLSSPSAKE